MKPSLLILAAIGAQACQRERAFQHHPHKRVKRQTAFPPALTPDEEILLNSFDSVSISEWSYYYSTFARLQDEKKTNRIQLMVSIWLDKTNPWVFGTLPRLHLLQLIIDASPMDC